MDTLTEVDAQAAFAREWRAGHDLTAPEAEAAIRTARQRARWAARQRRRRADPAGRASIRAGDRRRYAVDPAVRQRRQAADRRRRLDPKVRERRNATDRARYRAKTAATREAYREAVAARRIREETTAHV
jgi:hypothetical protein